MLRHLLAGLFALTLASTSSQAADPENTLVIELKTGKVFIEMLPNLAPNHVTRIKELTREGFYDGIVFHRVIPGFMAQTGDPKGLGTGGSGKKLKAEFSREPYVRGTVGMARSQNIHSGDSQFFIMFKRTPSLDGQYTVWGKVIQGMEHVDSIKKGPRDTGKVSNPDKMISVKVLADIQ
ncbi:peptidylprolyl isomerase [Kiloniella litopenaei]|uniref:Peptidyl-prolyl cis-trans isomerase n=1 Tax=Kiloniella litopenaei TaxID=1549748 RepID=A0A0M2R489_9PROT|nr:peptidylprolyl isomerase [Kiloniella litopenaei]